MQKWGTTSCIPFASSVAWCILRGQFNVTCMRIEHCAGRRASCVGRPLCMATPSMDHGCTKFTHFCFCRTRCNPVLRNSKTRMLGGALLATCGIFNEMCLGGCLIFARFFWQEFARKDTPEKSCQKSYPLQDFLFDLHKMSQEF